MRREIEEAIREELWELDIASPDKLEEMRDKDGIVLCRIYAENRCYVLKYLEKPEYRREIFAYQLLGFLEIPTPPLLSYTQRSILLEDFSCHPFYRLGREEDLSDVNLARKLAGWYRQLHEKGSGCADLSALYSELDALTPENFRLLQRRFGDFPGFSLLRDHWEPLLKAVNALPQTIVYNDFYWTNLLAARDQSAALMFDYNLLGRGYRYGDLRNVTSSLSPEAGEAFLEEYGSWSPEEEAVDRGIAPLCGLIAACGRDTLPGWAEESVKALRSGGVEQALRQLCPALP